MKTIGKREVGLTVEAIESDKGGWPSTIALILLFAAAVGIIALVLREQETKPLPPPVTIARSIAPAQTVKQDGYLIQVGELIAREDEPQVAQVATFVIGKGGKPSWLSCTLVDAKGSPMGGGGMTTLNPSIGATMNIQGPLLKPGRLDCRVIPVPAKGQ